jgi:hypothetical protein
MIMANPTTLGLLAPPIQMTEPRNG